MNKNQKNRYNGRYNNRGNKPQLIFRNTALDSTGPCGKVHGTALQLAEKYQSAAKDANLQNDTIMAETCLQYADHYMRLQNLAIANEEASKAKQAPAVRNVKAMENDVDELPDFGLPSDESVQNNEELTEEDKAIKNMDLSIPISAIQEKHQEAPKQQKNNRPMRKQQRPANKAAVKASPSLTQVAVAE